jgi:predicted small metal-binding protein
LYEDISKNMARLRCSDYGFECDFASEGEVEAVIEEFGKHTEEEHGIDYSKEALMQFILRQKY